MTQRQRKYWREMTKFANYKTVLLAVKGPNFELSEIDLESCGYDLNARTRKLEDHVHQMYIVLKSLGAINVANKLAKGDSITKSDLDKYIAEAQDEMKSFIESDSNIKNEEEGDEDD